MPSTRDINRILTGGNDVKRVMYRDAQVWPTAFAAVLEVVWVFGGQYTINAIPAGGGTATAQIWSLSIYRQSDGQLVDSIPVVPNNVTISDTTNFSYDAATGVWRANDRERNGINSTSGTTAPSNAPARSCTLHAAVQYTYHGVNVSASYDTTMTQNANNYTPGTAYYTNLRVALNRYNSSASPAPAYESTATISASLDQNTPGTFSSGSAYTYIQQNAVGSNRFSFTESASWISISGTTVTVYGRGTDNGASRNASILATFTGDTSIKSSVTLYQRDNYRYEKSRTYSSYETLLSDSRQGHGYEGIEIPKEGGYVYLIGTAWYDIVYGWPSKAPDTTGRDYRSQDPTYIYSDPSSGVTIDTSNARVQLPANSTSTPKEYDLWGAYTEDGVTRSSDRYSATVLGLSYEYGTPVVSFDYDLVADDYHIAAAGGSAVPYLSFRQPIIQGGTVVGHVRGSLSNGATSGTADDGTPFYVSFSGTGANGGSVAAGGTVSIGSRRTYTGNKRNAATNIKAAVVCHGVRGESDTVSEVTQQENRATPFSAYDEYYSATIKNLRDGSASGTIIMSISSAAPTTVYVEFVASWGHYDAGVEYTSGERTGGDYTYHDNESVTPYFLQVVGSSGGYNTNTFTASNQYNDSGAKKYTITAWFAVSDGPSDSVSIYQSADRKVSAGAQNYAATLDIDSSLWAGGGTARLIAYATHETYMTWQSDGSVVDGSLNTVYDDATVTIQSGTSSRFHLGSRTFRTDSSGHRYSEYTVKHDDMTNNDATDALVVRARNDSQTSATSPEIRRTVTNSPGTQEYYSYSSWRHGANYNGRYRIDDFLVNGYTSASNPAPSNDAEVSYSVSACHSVLRDDSRTKYTDRYYDSNWGSQHGGTDHNDASHRSRTETTEHNTVTVTEKVTGDGYTFQFESGMDWVTADMSAGVFRFSAQASGGAARDGYIYAKNVGGGSLFPVRVYQAGYAALSIEPNSLDFPATGGRKTFVIHSEYTGWTITYSPTSIQPALSFSTKSGGGIDVASKNTTINVIAGMNDKDYVRYGTVTITATAPGLEGYSILLRVTQSN